MKFRTFISLICAAAVMTAAGTSTAFAESEAPAASSADGSASAGAIVISGDDIRSAFGTGGTDTKAYVTFRELGRYELRFNFRLDSGAVKTYTVLSDRSKDLTAYVPMQDMLDKLSFSAEDVTDLTVDGPSLKDVTAVSMSLSAPTKTTTAAASGAGSTNTGSDKNPATGSEAPISALALTGICAAVVFGSVKLRRKMNEK